MSLLRDRMLNEVELLEAAVLKTRKDMMFVDIVPEFAGEVMKLFERQASLLEKAYAREKKKREYREAKAAWWHDAKAFDRWFDEVTAATEGEFSGMTKAQTKRAIARGINKGIADLQTAFNLANPAAQAWLNENAAWMVQHVNDATRNGLRQMLTAAREAGYSYDKTVRMMVREYGALSAARPQQHIRDRATLIATNETAKAYEKGTRLVVDKLMASGLVMEKRWLTAGGGRVDPVCAGFESDGYIAADEAFGGMTSEPPAHPACRCTLLYRRKGARYAESVAGMTTADRIRAFRREQPNASLRSISEALGVHYSQVYTAVRIGRSSHVVDSGT